EYRRGRCDRQIRPDGERQRVDPAELERHGDEDADENETPGKILAEEPFDDGRHQRGLRSRERRRPDRHRAVQVQSREADDERGGDNADDETKLLIEWGRAYEEACLQILRGS